MFRLSVITDEISQDLDIALQLAKEYGLDAIELRTAYDKGPFDFSAEDMDNMAAKIRAAGLAVSAISAPVFKCGIHNTDELALHSKGLDNCIRLADKLGTDTIRSFAFWKEGPLDDALALIAERYQEPIRKVKNAGMRLALESDPSVYTRGAHELKKVLDSIGCAQVGALWDPGNNIYSPDAEIPYPNGYEMIKNNLFHVHLKDAVLDENGLPVGCVFGGGLVDFKGQLTALAADGYTGYLAVETHYRHSSVLSKESLERPGGSAFSQDGYAPTRECLQALQTKLKEWGLNA